MQGIAHESAWKWSGLVRASLIGGRLDGDYVSVLYDGGKFTTLVMYDDLELNIFASTSKSYGVR